MNVAFFVRKVKTLLASQGLNIAQLCRDLKIARQNFFYWERGDRVPSTQSVTKIAEYLGVQTAELLDESYVPAVVVQYPEDNTPLPDGYIEIPEYELKFSAGKRELEPEWDELKCSRPAIYKSSFFHRIGANPSKCRRAKVQGDSMEPELHNGDIILFESTNTPFVQENVIVDGDIYVIAVDSACRIKRLSRIKNGIAISSFNSQEYPTETYIGEELDRIRILGKVLEVTRCY